MCVDFWVYDVYRFINYTYKSGLNTWEIDKEIDDLSLHIKKSIETSGEKNSLWEYFGLATIARPAEIKGGEESKLDYLAMQIESLRKNIESQKREKFIELPFKKVEYPSLYHNLMSVAMTLGAKIYSSRYGPSDRLIRMKIKKATLSEVNKETLITLANSVGYELEVSEV